jgi:Cu2+-exporting ATPase
VQQQKTPSRHDFPLRREYQIEKSLNLKKAILDVGGMSSVLDFRGVEKRLNHTRGVHAATVNIASNTAVVDYDERVIDVGALRAKIIECGFHCCGEVLPKHLCETPTAGHHETGLDASKTARH